MATRWSTVAGSIASLFVAVALAGCGMVKFPQLKEKSDGKQAGDKQPVATPNPQPAQVGVGRKGKSYGGGIITEPASQYWKAKEQIAFKIQIPSGMNTFKALNDRAPASHEEFMEKIINEGRIELPELPLGKRYEYDPKTEQLMVITDPPPDASGEGTNTEP